jgi:hypothetical protein
MSLSYRARAEAMLRSSDPAVQAAVKAANAGLVNCKALSPSAVHNDSTLSNLSIQYKNESLIGLQLMPVVTVSKLSDKYFKYGKRDRLAIPDTAVGSRSVPNEISETRSTDNYSCDGHALTDFVSEDAIKNQDAPLNEMIDLVASINDIMDLAEEKRIADIVTASASYDSANTAALSGSDRWDSSTGGNPVEDIATAIDGIWSGMGSTKLVGFCGAEVARVLQRHPMMLDMFKYTKTGLVPLADVANWFGLDAILVGKARLDTANEGQTASYSRLWGKQFGILRVATSPGPRTAAFGYTFRFGTKETTQWYDQKVGVRGGYYAKVGLSEDHKVAANDTGWLYTTVIS